DERLLRATVHAMAVLALVVLPRSAEARPDPWTGPARGSVPSPRDADGFGDDGGNGQAVSVGIDYGIRHTDVSGAFGEPSVVMRRRPDAREGGKAHSGSGTRSDRWRRTS